MKKYTVLFNDFKGFTLVEVIMTILILGVVFSIVTPIVIQSFNIFDISTRRMSANQLAEVAKNEVSQYLRTAIDGSFESNNGSWKFRGFHPESDNDPVNIEIKLENQDLILNVSKDNGEVIEDEKLIAYNVSEENFDISLNGNTFDITIEINDENNRVVKKNFTVISRN